jgi:hypothetical protein
MWKVCSNHTLNYQTVLQTANNHPPKNANVTVHGKYRKNGYSAVNYLRIDIKSIGGMVISLGINMWRQGFGEWLFPLQSPFSTAGLPAALEAAVTGGSTEESSTLILL